MRFHADGERQEWGAEPDRLPPSKSVPQSNVPAERIEKLVEIYPQDCRPQSVRFLGGAGGFSGAEFWLLQTAQGLLGLRRWPRQAGAAKSQSDWPERLRFMHAVLGEVFRRGAPPVAAPLRTRTGETFFEHAGRLWELTPWLPGQADYFPQRKPEKLRAALAALAEFHLAAANVNPPPNSCRSLSRRRQQIRALQNGGLEAIARAVEAAAKAEPGAGSDLCGEIVRPARRLLTAYAQAEEPVARQLASAERLTEIRLQACIRDIWHDHVLFQGERVSGLVDFGAMRVENVSCDIARLLGSMAGDNAADWQIGLSAYESLRPLAPQERQLVGVFDRSTTLLAGVNWLEWLFVERRRFADLPFIAARLETILGRLEYLAAGGSPDPAGLTR